MKSFHSMVTALSRLVFMKSSYRSCTILMNIYVFYEVFSRNYHWNFCASLKMSGGKENKFKKINKFLDF